MDLLKPGRWTKWLTLQLRGRAITALRDCNIVGRAQDEGTLRLAEYINRSLRAPFVALAAVPLRLAQGDATTSAMTLGQTVNAEISSRIPVTAMATPSSLVGCSPTSMIHSLPSHRNPPASTISSNMQSPIDRGQTFTYTMPSISDGVDDHMLSTLSTVQGCKRRRFQEAPL